MNQENPVNMIRMSLLVRWRTILFPFEQSQLIKQLPENGYVLTDEIRNRIPSYGARVEVTGVVARKGDVSLIFDTSRPGFQIEGADNESMVDELDILEGMISDSFNVESESIARFYEVDAQALIRSRKSPIEVVRLYGADAGKFEQIGDIIGIETGAYGFKISSMMSQPSDEDWFEMLLEPNSRSPHTDYFAYLILRKNNRMKVTDIARRIKLVFQQVIERLEQE
jgi:hypothetical protein